MLGRNPWLMQQNEKVDAQSCVSNGMRRCDLRNVHVFGVQAANPRCMQASLLFDWVDNNLK